LGYFFHGKSCVLILTRNWIGLHFGRLSHKLIWSPCLPSKVSGDRGDFEKCDKACQEQIYCANFFLDKENRMEFARKWWDSPENGGISPKMVELARKWWN
jgi:hypothetical protein